LSDIFQKKVRPNGEISPNQATLTATRLLLISQDALPNSDSFRPVAVFFLPALPVYVPFTASYKTVESRVARFFLV
jgi:hypothetical protein